MDGYRGGGGSLAQTQYYESLELGVVEPGATQLTGYYGRRFGKVTAIEDHTPGWGIPNFSSKFQNEKKVVLSCAELSLALCLLLVVLGPFPCRLDCKLKCKYLRITGFG